MAHVLQDQTVANFLKRCEDDLLTKIPQNFTDQDNQYQTWMYKEMRKTLFKKMDIFLLNTPQGSIWEPVIDAAKEPDFLNNLRNPILSKVLKNVPNFSENPEGFLVDDDGFVCGWPDGSCLPGGHTGIGVVLNIHHKENVGEPLEESVLPRTNHVAEIRAIIRLLEIAKTNGFDSVCVCSDSDLAILGVTKRIFNWTKNGWLSKKGDPVLEKEHFLDLVSAIQGMRIKWVIVTGHGSDIYNNIADSLARVGAIQARIRHAAVLAGAISTMQQAGPSSMIQQAGVVPMIQPMIHAGIVPIIQPGVIQSLSDPVIQASSAPYDQIQEPTGVESGSNKENSESTAPISFPVDICDAQTATSMTQNPAGSSLRSEGFSPKANRKQAKKEARDSSAAPYSRGS